MSQLAPSEGRGLGIGNPRRMLAIASTLVGLGLAQPAATAGSDEPVRANAASLGDCAPYFDTSRYTQHQYEVCTAYTGNSAGVALQGLYKYGNNRASYAADAAEHHFETRYFAKARQSIEAKVATWPRTSSLRGNQVLNSIHLRSLSSSLKDNRALLKTRESWKVRAPNGKLLYDEPSHTKNITMCKGKLPGHVLHAWFVVKFERAPNFDCKAFDRQNGLKP